MRSRSEINWECSISNEREKLSLKGKTVDSRYFQLQSARDLCLNKFVGLFLLYVIYSSKEKLHLSCKQMATGKLYFKIDHYKSKGNSTNNIVLSEV